MKMSAEMAGRMTGLALGLLVGLLLVVVILKVTKKDGKIKCKYDERQEVVRGRAFKYAFFTLMGCCIFYGVVNSMGERFYMDPLAGMVFNICVGVTVYASYCIWKESYFSLNENPKRVLIAFGVIGVFNTAMGISHICDGSIMENGMVSFRCVNLICGIMLFVIMGVIVAKKIALKREAE